MTTLFLSDLDGTLLDAEQRLSERTVDVVTRFVRGGGLFSYATARSLVTAQKVTRGLPLELPAIVYNGVFTVQGQPVKVLHSCGFTSTEAAFLRETLGDLGITPIVYALVEGHEKFSFIPVSATPGMASFLDSRLGDPRRRPVADVTAMYEGDAFYITCIGEGTELDPTHRLLCVDPRFTCIYQTDIYSGARWLEILPAGASKAAAALRLKELLGCDRLVAFGDGVNDLALFEVADECYAVENAVPELQAIATRVIGSNRADGVALWLEGLMSRR